MCGGKCRPDSLLGYGPRLNYVQVLPYITRGGWWCPGCIILSKGARVVGVKAPLSSPLIHFCFGTGTQKGMVFPGGSW